MYDNLSIKCIFASPFFKMKSLFHLILFFAVILLSSCSGYEKLLKNPDIAVKYNKAMEYYAKGDYVRAGTLFEMVNPFYKASRRADTINFYYAECLYKESDFIMAGHYFKEFTQTFPRSPFAEEAEYMNAYCYYLNSPRPTLDQQSTMEAIDAMQLFMIKFPDSKRIAECKNFFTELRERLMTKSYLNAKLYYDLGFYKSSIIALRNSLSEFPDSKYREEIMVLVVKSNFNLAEKSIDSKQKERYQNTLDEYYSFMTEFPKSKYSGDIQKIYKNLAEHLNL
jgi:outer membrane protein assembly factor BamD